MTRSLRIRSEQAAALVAAMAEGAEDRVGAHLRRAWPEETAPMSAEELDRWVRYGVDKGARYGIRAEYDVARLIDLMFALGPQFDESEAIPWAAGILADPALDGHQRVDALMRRAAAGTEPVSDRDTEAMP
jgi:hypothetical protein